MWLIALLVLQPLSFSAQQASPNSNRADLALRQAQESRLLAERFICGDPGRLVRLRELDEQFAAMRRQFVIRFGKPWTGDTMQAGSGASSWRELGRRDDCRLRDGFGGGMTDYENALIAARVELGQSSY